METLRIELLADHPDLIDLLAGWHHAAWGHLDPGGMVEKWRRELARHVNRDRIPTAFVAFIGDEPVGSASLSQHDMSGCPDAAGLSPWLADVYVVDRFRDAGIGAALVQHAVEFAREVRERRFYLYTDTAEGWYHRHGWRTLTRVDYHGTEQAILVLDLS